MLLALVLLAWKATHGIAAVWDVDCSDEQTLIEYACLIDKGHPPPTDASPLYVLWYRLLLVVEPDPAGLGSLNWSILAALVPLSLYVAVRSFGGARLAALLMAALL